MIDGLHLATRKSKATDRALALHQVLKRGIFLPYDGPTPRLVTVAASHHKPKSGTTQRVSILHGFNLPAEPSHAEPPRLA